MLRDEEKLGVLHCGIQTLIGHNDKVDDTSALSLVYSFYN
jgi:hypothetical protein